MKIAYPIIRTDFESTLEKTKNPFYTSAIERIMGHVLPPNFFEGEDALLRLFQKLPIVCWTPLGDPPFELSFFLWCTFRANAFRFFYEMISRWLIPGKRLNALLQFAIDFSMPELGPQKFIGGEVMVRIETAKELDILQQNLPIIESEIRMGVESYYQSCRILEIKGLTSDEKTAFIQENIVALIKHRPQDFDYDTLSEMQHFLVLCKEGFKNARTWRHMSRIICVHYLFRKALRFSLEVYPNKRDMTVKLIRAQINDKKKVLGVAIGMSFLRDNERFELSHIMSGILTILPNVREVEGSFFINQSRTDPTLTIYLEIEKEDGSPINLQEERVLKDELASELKNRIEHRLNPIFMPQNEEVIMRHILTLIGQLKYVRDLPQVIIDFSQQTEETLEFLVVALRVAVPKLKSIFTLFEAKPTFLEFVHDRTKIVGSLRKKYKKEASVFRLRILKTPFLRKDQSVDLYKARQEVAKELTRLIGEFRDYNGGTLSKETELFESLRRHLGQKAREHAFLLENYFYSLHPPIMRSVLPAEPIKKMFSFLLEAKKESLVEDEAYQIRLHYDSNYFYVLLTARDSRFRHSLLPVLKAYSGRIATCFVKQNEFPYFGLIFRNPDEEEALRLRLSVEQAMAEIYSFSFKPGLIFV